MPLTPTLSPLVPHGERDKISGGCIKMRPIFRRAGLARENSSAGQLPARAVAGALMFRGRGFRPGERCGRRCRVAQIPRSATLETARSERIAGVLNIGNPAQSRRCTVCHAPFHTLRAGQLDKEASISEGVFCETGPGPSENWLRAHTRPDWSHEDRVHAGMRDLKNLYIRANTCVACHQNVDSDVQQAGHPELIFELDGQAVSQPRHWRQSEEKPGPQIWLVGQAVALREMSWQLAREKSPGQTLVERWAGLFWLVQAAGEVEGHLTGVESNSTARTAEQFDQVQRWSDRFAKEVAALRWSEERTRRCLALLAN